MWSEKSQVIFFFPANKNHEYQKPGSSTCCDSENLLFLYTLFKIKFGELQNTKVLYKIRKIACILEGIKNSENAGFQIPWDFRIQDIKNTLDMVKSALIKSCPKSLWETLTQQK